MFIRVTTVSGAIRLINTDHVYCIAENNGKSEIIYTDDTNLTTMESVDEIEQMLKGVNR